jgi:hypothetical protein
MLWLIVMLVLIIVGGCENYAEQRITPLFIAPSEET